MDHESPELLETEAVGDTPEDVAVLYSWANLQGAKYRDFSAARREYRAAMRHRAAEEQRFSEAALQAEAEAAAAEAERAAREAEEAARFHETAAKKAAAAMSSTDRATEEAARARALRHAEEMSRIAAAERIEAARRAEAVAAAEASARREAREMEEARASAERQAARYAESGMRMEHSGIGPVAVIPGQISDPYIGTQQTLPGRIFHQPAVPDEEALPARHIHQGQRMIVPRPEMDHGRLVGDPREFIGFGDLRHDADIAAHGTAAILEASERPNSGVKSMYSEPDSIETRAAVDEYARRSKLPQPPPPRASSRATEIEHISHFSSSAVPILRDSDIGPAFTAKPQPVDSGGSYEDRNDSERPVLERATVSTRSSGPRPVVRPSEDLSVSSSAHSTFGLIAAKPIQFDPQPERTPHRTNGLLGLDLDVEPDEVPVRAPRVAAHAPRPFAASQLSMPVPVARPVSAAQPIAPQPVLTPVAAEPSEQQRAYAAAKAEAAAKAAKAQADVAETRRIRGYAPDEASGFFAAYGSARAQQVAPPPAPPVEPEVPAWLDATPAFAAAEPPARRKAPSSAANPTAAAPAGETLQGSRERVAARWYALKGVFDHGVQEMEAEREKRDEVTEAPLTAVFSLAGGVGKTSLVATLGRALSASGEKILLTDTTSHGLLPFYFGASELRPGVMRTFSPPSGSSDAAICLLSYDVLQRSGDQASQDWFANEMRTKSKGMARAVLDLSSSAPWVARRISRMDATILIPLAPDMNSVISLGAIEKFFAGMKDSANKPVQPFYIMNMFDSSLALHLDVREVLRQRLGDRLLAFSIRRASAVPEALAEGMTVIDYASDSPVAEDYRSLAVWLKTKAAPAMATNSTARWSER